MIEKCSIDEILEKYEKVEFKSKNLYGNSSLEFLSDFFKDIECDKYFFRTNDGLPLDSNQVENYTYASLVENGEQLACLDRDNITIRSKDKRVSLSTREYNESVYNDVITMFHSTDDGLYYFMLRAFFKDGKVEQYVFDLMHYPKKNGQHKMNVGVNQPFPFITDEYTVARFKPIEIAECDIPKLTNKLFKEGLSDFCEKVRNGETFLKIDDEQEKKVSNIVDSNENSVETSEQLNNDKNENLSINQVIDTLVYLRDKGVELSEEQKNMIYLYKDVISDNYKQSNDGFEEENSKIK